MKITVSFALFVTFVFSACIPAFAQKGGAKNVQVNRVNFVQFERVEALTAGRGVLIRWEMRHESGNAGFYVYRVGEAGFELVDQIMILGSSARVGSQTLDGEKYELFDPEGGLNSTYVVESLALSGRITRSLPVSPQYSSDLNAKQVKKNGNLEKGTLSLTKELENIVQASQLPPNLATHRWVVSQPGAKIAVRRDGLYRVSRAELQAAGFDVNSNSANWRLFMEGNEHAIIVGAAGQYIDFFGRGIDTVESDTRIYYLISGNVAGQRMGTRVLRPVGGAVLSRNYPTSAEKKERVSYLNTIINDDAENYWGRVVTSTPVTIPFSISGIDFSAPNSTVIVKMQGFSSILHSIRVVVNGHEVGFATGDGQLPFSTEFLIPTNFLVEGNNTLQLNSMSSGDLNLFDTVTVNYPRKYEADQNKVSFFTPGYKRVDLGGFTSPNIRVFETTYDGSPRQIINLPVEQVGGAFTVKLPSSRTMVSYAAEDSGLLQSPAVTRNIPSTLSTSGNNAKLIIISHSAPDFMAAAETWANYRRTPEFPVNVIDVADVFDEFNYGLASAASINSFLDYAVNNWQTPPQYVLLMGDGSYDPRNYEGLGYWNLVPPKIVVLNRGLYYQEETSSDEALADFNDDGLAELAIGRIPARTAADITTAYNKTTNFETPAQQSFDRGAIFAYDLPNTYDFEDMSRRLRNELPQTMPAFFIGRGDPGAQTTLINEINNGRYIVNWSGHGSSGLWAHPSFFGIDNVPQLTNANDESIITMLTCFNGYFIRLRDIDASLGERLLTHQNGGAVATWASSGQTTPDVQMAMALRFYNQLNAGNITRMGDLIRDAKSVLPGGIDVRFSWIYFGDPMLKVRASGD